MYSLFLYRSCPLSLLHSANVISLDCHVSSLIISSTFFGSGSVSYPFVINCSSEDSLWAGSFVKEPVNKLDLAFIDSKFSFFKTVWLWCNSLSSPYLGRSPDLLVRASGFPPCFPGR